MNLDRFDNSADALLRIENRIARDVSAPFQTVLKRVLALLQTMWPGDDSTPQEQESVLTALNLELFMGPVDAIQEQIRNVVLQAYALGIDTGIFQAGLKGTVMATTFKRVLSPELQALVRSTGAVMRRRVEAGSVMLVKARTLEQAQTAVALANPSRVIERHARWLTNRASNEGLVTVAEADARSVLVWRAERDGCVHCLAYQGETRTPRGYPQGLTFGKKPLHRNPVLMPPLHPWCRCTQWLINRSVVDAVKQSLKREAKRSILKGWSRPSEPNTVRVDAARKLLAQNPTVPKSVQAYARKAVNEGHFKRGRGFPSS